ncbi:MAG: hypothetical protein EON52_22265 [Actinomycetales bacterium]|nr:MAG: hypothetical protein EON52_22265 [Actinomycetales bacterium]
MTAARPPGACPCGSDLPYPGCCGRWHSGEPAPSAEALMRSRYSAFVRHDEPYLLRTWHETTRPAAVDFDPLLLWTGLDVVRAEPRLVEFRAHYRRDGEPGVVHEVSRFVHSGEGWQYVRGRLRGETSP